MPDLKAKPTLADIQGYVMLLEKERGFAEDSVLQKCLLLSEEVGELFKAVRKEHAGMPLATDSTAGQAEEEMADILVVLSTIANRLGIDLEQALRAKEEKNKQRRWS